MHEPTKKVVRAFRFARPHATANDILDWINGRFSERNIRELIVELQQKLKGYQKQVSADIALVEETTKIQQEARDKKALAKSRLTYNTKQSITTYTVLSDLLTAAREVGLRDVPTIVELNDEEASQPVEKEQLKSELGDLF